MCAYLQNARLGNEKKKKILDVLQDTRKGRPCIICLYILYSYTCICKPFATAQPINTLRWYILYSSSADRSTPFALANNKRRSFECHKLHSMNVAQRCVFTLDTSGCWEITAFIIRAFAPVKIHTARHG